jgi:hypothetical protein
VFAAAASGILAVETLAMAFALVRAHGGSRARLSIMAGAIGAATVAAIALTVWLYRQNLAVVDTYYQVCGRKLFPAQAAAQHQAFLDAQRLAATTTARVAALLVVGLIISVTAIRAGWRGRAPRAASA